jgi:hypothetical protein
MATFVNLAGLLLVVVLAIASAVTKKRFLWVLTTLVALSWLALFVVTLLAIRSM